MKVNERKGLIDPAVAGPAVRPDGGAVAPEPPASTDKVSVSDAARDLARLRGEVGDVNTVNVEKVSGLSAVMAKGQYSADVRDVATKVLRSILGELLS
jgi:anti-sigma28 factor (negative regulator of flagellin synthesis)